MLPIYLLVAIGLFAEELGELHVPGIWFPFGIGVSRTQLAYAALVVALSIKTAGDGAQNECLMPTS